ncbi:MAG: galactose-1-phosphate uridylyltransferase [Chloroflexi bacterium]|nr:galactose-1-phosphate uridylyltransferase [Chloroflexota bacterium]
MLDEQVIVSTGRQERTFLPPADACPLCPTAPGAEVATEVPSTTFEIAVFENRFPSLRMDAPAPQQGGRLERRSTAHGRCEVIVYTPEHAASLASLTDAQMTHMVDVWADRYRDLAAQDGIDYVFIFENRGREIGVTLTHPHGQIYAFPYIPPQVATEQRTGERHGAGTGRCLQCDIVADERAAGMRVVAEAAGFLAYVPFAARVPYEVHIAATAHRPSLPDLDAGERAGLGSLVRRVQQAYDALWDRAMPYTMSMHQRATDGVKRAGDHLHIEFMPPYRSRDKLKYLAGVETGAGTYINDTAPEEKAAELRQAAQSLRT